MSLITTRQAESLVDTYFKYIKGEFHMECIPSKTKNTDEAIQQKVWDREPEPPTLAGLALHLGFDSLKSFDDCEQNDNLGPILKRARLRVEAEYEKKLHQSAPTGAIFALKNFGWNERDMNKNIPTGTIIVAVNIVDNGIATASEERDIIL